MDDIKIILFKMTSLTGLLNKILYIKLLIIILLIIYIINLTEQYFVIKIYSLVFFTILFIFTVYLLFINRSISKKHSIYYKLLYEVTSRNKVLEIPSTEINEVYLEIGKKSNVKKRRISIEVYIDYRDRKPGKYIVLKHRPQLFIGIIDKYSRQITSFYYKGKAYLVRYMGEEFFIIPLYPQHPILDKNILKVKDGRDYCELVFSLENNILNGRIIYVKHRSSKACLSLSINNKHSLYIRVLEINRPGEYVFKQVFNTLTKTHILVIPNDKRYLSTINIDADEFLVEADANEYMVLGYDGLKLNMELFLPEDTRKVESIVFNSKPIL